MRRAFLSSGYPLQRGFHVTASTSRRSVSSCFSYPMYRRMEMLVISVLQGQTRCGGTHIAATTASDGSASLVKSPAKRRPRVTTAEKKSNIAASRMSLPSVSSVVPEVTPHAEGSALDAPEAKESQLQAQAFSPRRRGRSKKITGASAGAQSSSVLSSAKPPKTAATHVGTRESWDVVSTCTRAKGASHGDSSRAASGPPQAPCRAPSVITRAAPKTVILSEYALLSMVPDGRPSERLRSSRRPSAANSTVVRGGSYNGYQKNNLKSFQKKSAYSKMLRSRSPSAAEARPSHGYSSSHSATPVHRAHTPRRTGVVQFSG